LASSSVTLFGGIGI